MSRAYNPDGTPWWVSTGPPHTAAETAPSAQPSAPQSENQAGESAAHPVHDVDLCGNCPLCVLVAGLRDKDQELGDTVVAAMKGSTQAIESLAGRADDLIDMAMTHFGPMLMSSVLKNFFRQ